jgi:hypothetical protein
VRTLAFLQSPIPFLILMLDLDSLDVGDFAPPTVKFSDAKCHASLLSSFLLENSILVLMKLLVIKS